MANLKKKTIWILVSLGFALAVSYFFAIQQRFTAVSQDGHSETDIDGSRIGVGSTDWQSPDGMLVFEYRRHYSSPENARNALEKYLETCGNIIERQKNPERFSSVAERILTADGPKADESGVTLIKLRKNKIYFYQAYSVEAVLAFEKSWLKLPW
jgi:hypothetical protein